MDIRQELIDTYRWLRRYGLNDSHSGNASVRVGDDLWITPTGACADRLRVEDLIQGRIEGPPPAGGSLDTPLHQAVYRANPGARAVLHSHGPCSIALTLDGRDFTPVDFEGHAYFGTVPVIADIAYEDYVAEAPQRVAEILKDRRITIVRGHGVYACGDTLDLAYKWTCSLESSARLALLARQAGTLPAQGT
ncbi:class II aldolase/adducin family protein [Thiohalobacter sp. IOR34]|uniref:class II aldolase/adducin family protein n=1 Tax=Thiohalobacter sp. IOR34 TaxID=3057176 RepID=UPI0025B083FA|nr:class II aldolase/adducin family protein [Thiohalobacter sp. IOR34]WJW75229.1 class II aldolase/adducin family protein [Thiohalobacter sp. IOR34]